MGRGLEECFSLEDGGGGHRVGSDVGVGHWLGHGLQHGGGNQGSRGSLHHGGGDWGSHGGGVGKVVVEVIVSGIMPVTQAVCVGTVGSIVVGMMVRVSGVRESVTISGVVSVSVSL